MLHATMGHTFVQFKSRCWFHQCQPLRGTQSCSSSHSNGNHSCTQPIQSCGGSVKTGVLKRCSWAHANLNFGFIWRTTRIRGVFVRGKESRIGVALRIRPKLTLAFVRRSELLSMFGLTGALGHTGGLQFAGWCELGHNQKPPSAKTSAATLSNRLDLHSFGQTVLIPSVGYESIGREQINVSKPALHLTAVGSTIFLNSGVSLFGGNPQKGGFSSWCPFKTTQNKYPEKKKQKGKKRKRRKKRHASCPWRLKMVATG